MLEFYYSKQKKGLIHIKTHMMTTGTLRKKYSLKLFLVAMPFILILFVLNYVPLFGWVYAFFDYKAGIPLSKTPFVGFKYFQLILSDGPDTLRVLVNTLALSMLSIIVSPFAVAFAIFLNEIKNVHFKKLVQTTTTLPNFVSWIIVYSLSFTFFSQSDGMLNQLFLNLGLIKEPMNILGNENAVWFFQITLQIWKTLGWTAIIYIAAIAGIDAELYDAIKVDGGGRFRSIIHITIPGIAMTFLVLLVLNVANLLNVGFDQYFIFNNPSVADKIEVIDLYVYRMGIQNNDYAYATAVGMLKTIVSISLLFTVNKIAKRVRGESII
jgi:putative aldouronate transport system permease protein